MKKLIYLLAVLGLAMTVSCGNSAKREQEIRDSLRADSIMKDSIIRAKIDSIRKDSMWRYRVTPDLALFELHGPVKSVSSSEWEMFSYEVNTITFDEVGRLTSVHPYKIFRDKSDRVNALKYITNGFEEDAWYFTYNLQNQATKVRNQGYEWGGTTSYKYGEDGFASSSYSSGSGEGMSWEISVAYKYQDLDDFGNWTTRKYTRTSLETDECEEYPVPTKTTSTGTQSRIITYYEK